jgi:hypothetical protein
MNTEHTHFPKWAVFWICFVEGLLMMQYDQQGNKAYSEINRGLCLKTLRGGKDNQQCAQGSNSIFQINTWQVAAQ